MSTLTTKDLLRSRRVAVDALCPTCNAHVETIFHTLVTCSYAESCWSEAIIHMLATGLYTFPQWLQSVFQQHDKTQATSISMICWMIWKHQNNLVWNQAGIKVKEVVRSSTPILNQWRNVQYKTFNHLMSFTTQGDGAERWHKPQINNIKINTDAAIFEESHRFSYAIVVRDHTGSLIEASSKCRDGRVNPYLAEAFGIKEALIWIISNEYKNVTVETDCLQLVQAIRNSLPSYSYVGQLIQDCRDMLASLISKNICFRFVKRSANRAAHHPGRYNCSLADRVWRMGDVHSEFYNVLLEDSS
ncbi:uncharacterized protein LOC141719580 [Apium graveolens]|uniref:uncharacterized protein LOC141719580 n=1 Tax=Apium graveolens TaxID=4045 RepID=UPI003D790A8D